MANQGCGLYSYTLPISDFGKLARRDLFWPTLHDHGQLVDRLPGITSEVLDILLDFLATDFGIGIPRSFEQQFFICTPPEVEVIGLCTRHDLRVLHTRIEKMGTHKFTTSSVLENYARNFPGSSELEQDYTGFLARQWKNLKNEDFALLLLCLDEQ